MRPFLPLAYLAALAVPCLALARQDGPRAGSLDQLSWLAGHWRQESGRGAVEELWMPPRGGLMLGLNRSVGPADAREPRASFEYLRIEAGAGGPVYWASPGGASPTAFRLVESSSAHAVFENRGHDFPQRIEYRLEKDHLTASISGDRPGPSWTFTRVGDVD